MSQPILTLDTLQSASDWHFLKSNREVYIEQQNIRLNLYGPDHDLRLSITRLDNAMKVGATCEGFSLELGSLSGWCRLIRSLDYELSELMAVLDVVSFSGPRPELFGATVTRLETAAIRVFSPFHLARLKPLDKFPSRWTVKHALRAIANGQFTSFRCTGRYTDDYAYDAEVNCHKGPVQHRLSFLRRVVENPSGWRVDDDGGSVVSIRCHTFDNNEIHLDLGASCAA